MADQDDDRWLDALAGRPTGPVKGEAEKEGIALRRALEALEQAEARKLEAEAASDEHASEQLVFRLRRERLTGRDFMRRYGAPIALAAGIAVLAIALVPTMKTQEPAVQQVYEEPPTLRGEAQEQTVTSADPRGDAERLAADLKAARVNARLYQDKTAFITEYTLDPPNVKNAAELLAKAGVQPREGLNRVAFRPREK